MSSEIRNIILDNASKSLNMTSKSIKEEADKRGLTADYKSIRIQLRDFILKEGNGMGYMKSPINCNGISMTVYHHVSVKPECDDIVIQDVEDSVKDSEIKEKPKKKTMKIDETDIVGFNFFKKK